MERKTNMDNREHQAGMDTGVNGAKGCFKLFGHVLRAGGMPWLSLGVGCDSTTQCNEVIN